MFTMDFSSRLDGKAQILSLTEAEVGASGTVAMAEMCNENVQVYGDVAILSYNYMGVNDPALKRRGLQPRRPHWPFERVRHGTPTGR